MEEKPSNEKEKKTIGREGERIEIWNSNVCVYLKEEAGEFSFSWFIIRLEITQCVD